MTTDDWFNLVTLPIAGALVVLVLIQWLATR